MKKKFLPYLTFSHGGKSKQRGQSTNHFGSAEIIKSNCEPVRQIDVYTHKGVSVIKKGPKNLAQ